MHGRRVAARIASRTRHVHLYVWRQSQHHLFTTFDASDAQTACTKRNRSNTPLQALHLANDPVFVELARFLAKRIDAEGPTDDAGRIDVRGFRVCFSRTPTTAEAARLQAYIDAKRARPTRRSPPWAALARVLMNLDEFITRE